MHLAAPTRNSGHGGRGAIAINPIQNYPTKADPEGFETGMLQPSSIPQTHFSSFLAWSTRHTNFPRHKRTDFTTKGHRRQFTSGAAKASESPATAMTDDGCRRATRTSTGGGSTARRRRKTVGYHEENIEADRRSPLREGEPRPLHYQVLPLIRSHLQYSTDPASPRPLFPPPIRSGLHTGTAQSAAAHAPWESSPADGCRAAPESKHTPIRLPESGWKRTGARWSDHAMQHRRPL